jgi:hypothetical protein
VPGFGGEDYILSPRIPELTPTDFFVRMRQEHLYGEKIRALRTYWMGPQQPSPPWHEIEYSLDICGVPNRAHIQTY